MKLNILLVTYLGTVQPVRDPSCPYV